MNTFIVSLALFVVGIILWIFFDRKLNRLLVRHDPDYGDVQAIRQESKASLSSPHPAALAIFDAVFHTTARFRRAKEFKHIRPVANTVMAGRVAMLLTLAGTLGLLALLFNEMFKEMSQ